jgi:hypothetical protein
MDSRQMLSEEIKLWVKADKMVFNNKLIQMI